MDTDFEALNEWIKPCANHLHWSATSTYDGNGLVIWAKFKSFLRHMVNKHSDHSDPLFNQCAHGVIREFKFDFRYQYQYRCLHFRSHFGTGNFKALSYHDR
jgi:hypothetical protein